MHPRSMFFTLYGVYVRHFADEIGISSLVQLLSEFGFSEQATRATLSRLAVQGWVESRKAGRNSYLKMTPRGLQRVADAADRIYRLKREPWDGCWLLLTYTIPEEKRGIRDQLRQDLSWWGFGTLSTSTWLSPHNLVPQMQNLIEAYDIAPYVDFFSARYKGPDTDRALVEKGWNLAAINAHYRQFLQNFRPELEQIKVAIALHHLNDRDCFVKRTRLVHEYRKFLFLDPGLPEELLGEDWLGSEAFDFFRAYDHLLAEGAGRYFYSIFNSDPAQNLSLPAMEHGLQAQLDPFGGSQPLRIS